MSVTTRPAGASTSAVRRRPPELVIALIGAMGFATAAVIGAIIQPSSYRWTRDTISVLAAQDAVLGELMVAGFLVLAVGLAALAAGLWRCRPTVSARIAATLVGTSAAATVVAGLARIRCNPAQDGCLESLLTDPSRASEIHFRVAILVFAPLILSGLALAWSQWRLGLRRLATVLGASAGLSLALIVLTEDAGTGIGGLLQRMFLITALLPGMLTLAFGAARTRVAVSR